MSFSDEWGFDVHPSSYSTSVSSRGWDRSDSMEKELIEKELIESVDGRNWKTINEWLMTTEGLSPEQTAIAAKFVRALLISYNICSQLNSERLQSFEFSELKRKWDAEVHSRMVQYCRCLSSSENEYDRGFGLLSVIYSGQFLSDVEMSDALQAMALGEGNSGDRDVYARVNSLDLDWVKDLLVQQDGFSEDDAEASILVHKAFIGLCGIKKRKMNLAPIWKKADEAWHHHLKDEVRYIKDCETVLGPGGFLHHREASSDPDVIAFVSESTARMRDILESSSWRVLLRAQDGIVGCDRDCSSMYHGQD